MDGKTIMTKYKYSEKILIYSLLILWAFICLFPIFWTVTTTFKIAPNVQRGDILPWIDFVPRWKGLRSLGMSPDTIFNESTVRDEFLKRFFNTFIISTCASALAVFLGTTAAYGLSRFNYKFGPMRNPDISFFWIASSMALLNSDTCLEGRCRKISPLPNQTELHLLQVSSSTPLVVGLGSKLQSLQLGHFMR